MCEALYWVLGIKGWIVYSPLPQGTNNGPMEDSCEVADNHCDRVVNKWLFVTTLIELQTDAKEQW